jgi:cyanophycinase-like exopeptidase
MLSDILIRIVFVFLMPLGVFGQSYTSYFTGNYKDTVTIPKGGICLMGGATEDDEAMKWFLNQSSNGDILVLRTSGSSGYNNYMYSQLGIHVNSVETIVCNNKQASGDSYLKLRIIQAEGIWFAGGDQWDYISYWRGTPIDSLINDAIQNRHIVIGGTSAGMAIQGGFYFSASIGSVTSAQALSNPYNSQMTIDSTGFLKNKFLETIITDTHYDDPDRKGRHVAFLARILTDWGIEAKGIASDAYAAICIDTTGLARCYGNYPQSNDYLYFLQTNCELADNRPEMCLKGSPLDWNRNAEAIKVYKVQGTSTGENSFNLKDWKTGSGGSWENWYVNQGVLYQIPGNEINCDDTTGIKSTTDNSEIQVFPNPANGGELKIVFPQDEVYYISIVDVLGRIVRQVPETSENIRIIDVSGLSKGLYYVRMDSGSKTKRFGVVID